MAWRTDDHDALQCPCRCYHCFAPRSDHYGGDWFAFGSDLCTRVPLKKGQLDSVRCPLPENYDLVAGIADRLGHQLIVTVYFVIFNCNN